MYLTVFNGIVLDISLSVISDKCDKNLQKLLLTDKSIYSLERLSQTKKMKQLKVASMNYKKQKKEIWFVNHPAHVRQHFNVAATLSL